MRFLRARKFALNHGDGSGNADLRSAPLREAQRNRESLIGKNRGQVRERRPLASSPGGGRHRRAKRSEKRPSG